jgi:hypothetical protein
VRSPAPACREYTLSEWAKKSVRSWFALEPGSVRVACPSDAE